MPSSGTSWRLDTNQVEGTPAGGTSIPRPGFRVVGSGACAGHERGMTPCSAVAVVPRARVFRLRLPKKPDAGLLRQPGRRRARGASERGRTARAIFDSGERGTRRRASRQATIATTPLTKASLGRSTSGTTAHTIGCRHSTCWPQSWGTRAVSRSRKIVDMLAACSTRRPDFPKAITHPGSTMKRTTFLTITTVVVV